MSLQIAFFRIYDVYKFLDPKLDELEFTDPEKWAVKWLIKNTLLTTFLLCQFYHVRRHFRSESLLKMSSFVITLTAVWIPCLKAYPLLSVLLMLLETFFITIGPLHAIPHLIRNLRYESEYDQSVDLLGIDKGQIFAIAFVIYRTRLWESASCTYSQCIFSMALFYGLVWDCNRRED